MERRSSDGYVRAVPGEWLKQAFVARRPLSCLISLGYPSKSGPPSPDRPCPVEGTSLGVKSPSAEWTLPNLEVACNGSTTLAVEWRARPMDLTICYPCFANSTGYSLPAYQHPELSVGQFREPTACGSPVIHVSVDLLGSNHGISLSGEIDMSDKLDSTDFSESLKGIHEPRHSPRVTGSRGCCAGRTKTAGASVAQPTAHPENCCVPALSSESCASPKHPTSI